MISSLEALRKLTKPNSESSDPLEGFQQYLETKKRPVPKLNSVQIFRRGAGFGKLLQILSQSNSKQLEKSLKIWKFETIRPTLESNKDFIESQISLILFKALTKIQSSHSKTCSKYFYAWKFLQSQSSAVPLIHKLNFISIKTKKFALNKLFFQQNEKTRIIYFVINNLTGVIRKKFLLWKKNTDKISTEIMVIQKNAVLNFREFTKIKILDLIFSYRKARQLFLKKYFFRWTLVKPPVVKEQEEVKKVDNEGIALKNLKRQKEKHFDAVTEANIKIQLVELMIKTMNSIYK